MISAFFIKRPIFATVLALILVIAGLVSMTALPVAQYPPITPVQIQITTTYPGANAETVGKSVASPIEAQINGVENMLYMKSTSSNTGQLQITVYFSLDTDPDIAQVLVQNRVNLALPQLPIQVQQFGISVAKQSTTTLMVVAIYDKEGRYTPDYVATYTNVYILDAIQRIKGAGQAHIFGLPDQAMRIWMNPDKMASLAISTIDIQEAIAGQNALIGAGQIGQEPSGANSALTFPIAIQEPYTKPQEYENMILRADQKGSALVRIGDVARVEVGKKQYIENTFLNGAPSTALAIYQQPGANGLEVSSAVKKKLEELKKTMPEGIDYLIALDTTDFVRISIKEVLKTLVEALILVILVVYLFLQNFRATFICSTAILVSLAGTFTGLLFFGFSINLLTLFAMVLAIGIVVDDAIIVVENVERNLHASDMSPQNAAIKAMEEVSGPVIAVVFVLSAVFIPAAFLPGTTGQLYKQFAVTIIISVIISGLVALTLTPAMCALLLKRKKEEQWRFFTAFNCAFEKSTKAYGRSLKMMVAHLYKAGIIFGAMLAMMFYGFYVIPKAFVPNEDQGYFLAQVVMPDSSSLQRTGQVTEKLHHIFRENAAVSHITVVNGFSLIDSQYQSNMATFFVTLKSYEERYKDSKTAKEQNVKAVLRSVYARAREIPSALIIPIAPPAIPGIGTTAGFELWIQSVGNGNSMELYNVTQNFLQKAQESPVLQGLNSTFKAASMQLRADVDRPRTTLLGIDIAHVYNTLQAQFGSLQVSQYQQYSRVWDVMLQADATYRATPADLTRLYVKSKKGDMIPLNAVVNTSYGVGSSLIPHFNGIPAAQITGNAAIGYSSGAAMEEMESIARQVLPQEYSFSWSGMALQETASGRASLIAFSFGLLIVFLILAAQYESWSLPFTVITAVPFGIMGALLATYLRDLQNDVYFQIGLLVLVGLCAKNAILIVEFAVEMQEKGKNALDAAVIAGELRLRPIIMTSLAFILGVAPLYFASGAGANARHSIGTGIIGGMLGASTLALLYVPLFYCILDRIKRCFHGKEGNA
jgi:multidrug efflux pump